MDIIKKSMIDFLQNITVEELGSARVAFMNSPSKIYDPTLDIFIPDKNGLSYNDNKNAFYKALSSTGIDDSKLETLFNPCVEFPEELFNLGFIILGFKDEFKYYPNKFIVGYDYRNAEHQNKWSNISKFINLELSPSHFTLGLHGSRNIVYKIAFPKEFNLSIAIRKRLSKIDKSRILQKDSKFKFRDDIPQKDYKTQIEIQEKLFNLSNKARVKNKNIAKVPSVIFVDPDDNYQVIEFVNNPTLLKFRLDNKIEPNTSGRVIIDKGLENTFTFWENEILFKHNDFHANNVLIDPDSKDLTVIDFDVSVFCDTREQFNEKYSIPIGNKEIVAGSDRGLAY
jgi:tRNA A-37 threonylcarbamoyl transferase component Bud32